jgi:hypothetical protein
MARISLADLIGEAGVVAEVRGHRLETGGPLVGAGAPIRSARDAGVASGSILPRPPANHCLMAPH